MIMDWNTLEIGEDLTAVTQKSKQAALDEIVARHTASLRKELQYQGGKLVSNPQVNRVAVNPVSQMDYNCRLYALLNIIRNPELSIERYPLANSWKMLYPRIPYREKATNWNISKKDAATMKALMKELNVYRTVSIIEGGVKAVIIAMKDVHKTQVIEQQLQTIADQDERIKNYQFLMDGTEDRIIYKGHVLPYSAKHRGYHITLGGKNHVISQKNIQKLQTVFDFIDMFE